MNLTKWRNPATTFFDNKFSTGLLPVQQEMNDMMEMMDVALNQRRFLNSDYDLTRFSPSIDVQEDQEKYILQAELPGIKEKDISVDLHKNTLTIKGNKIKEHKVKNEEYVCLERSAGNFNRRVTFPTSVNPDSFKAELKNGVLNIECLKDQKGSEKHKRIPVET